MTNLMKEAIDTVSQLPDSEQDRLASLLLAELESEQRWAKSFAESQDVLSDLADEALAELKAGHTQPLDPTEL